MSDGLFEGIIQEHLERRNQLKRRDNATFFARTHAAESKRSARAAMPGRSMFLLVKYSPGCSLANYLQTHRSYQENSV